MSRILTRRGILQGLTAAAGSTVLAGCDALGESPGFRAVLHSAERLTYRTHRLITSPDTLAREFARSDMSPIFRANGNQGARSPEYRRHLAENFSNWQLQVGGLVERPQGFSLAQLRSWPARSQITRHDCVEGWSAIGHWAGPPLKRVLDAVGLKPQARFIVFHCADDFDGMDYYESVDLVDAFHPQTILAHTMNDKPLPVAHGAPIRMRVERQLGYKHAKFVMRIEAVASLAGVRGGNGGYWEDTIGYEWYAGI